MKPTPHSVAVSISFELAALIIAIAYFGLTICTREQRQSGEQPQSRVIHTPLIPYRYGASIRPAAHELAEHIYGLCSPAFGPTDRLEDARYTAYVLGRYLAWTRLGRYHSQLNHVTQDENGPQSAVEKAFAERAHEAAAFRLSPPRMLGIAEAMTVWVSQHERWRCMGFVEFNRLWETDETFRAWFEPVVKGREELGNAEGKNNFEVTTRLRRVQHQLVRVVRDFDPEQKTPEEKQPALVEIGRWCECGLTDACKASAEQRKREYLDA